MKKIKLITLSFLLYNITYSQKIISIDSISNHIGQKITICSKVFGTKYLDQSQMTFLNVGAAFPNSPLTIVIFGKDRINFKNPPEAAYDNKEICVTGTVKEYKGKSEIIVSKPDEIIVK